jgi:hypothetical protein
MVRLPQRTREHVLEGESIKFIEQSFPPEWIIESGQKDYGIDLLIEIVRNSDVTGAHFLMQIKGTDLPKITESKYITYRCKTSTLQYFLERHELIIFLIYDSKERVGYWIWIQDFIRNNLKEDWKNQKTATVLIPLENRLDKKSVEIIEQRVLMAHDQSKWLTTIQTIQNPYIDYRLTYDKENVKIGVYGKYPGALEDHPRRISGTFKFDQSPEAQEALKSLENAFKTGETVRLDSRFIKDFDPTQLAPEIFAQLGKLEIKEIEIETAKGEEGFIGRLEILDNDGNTLAEIPYVDFKVIQAGTEETTYSNEHQTIPLKIKWKLNIAKQTSYYNFAIGLLGINVLEIQRVAKFFVAAKDGKWFQLTDLTKGLTIRENLPESIVTGLDDNLTSIIDNLVLIQKKTGQAILFPDKIATIDLSKMNYLVRIITTGSIHQRIPIFSLSANKDFAIKCASAYERSLILSWQFERPESKFHFLGIDLNLGPSSIILPSATLEPETRKRLSELDNLADDAIVNISLDLDDRGMITYFQNWLPK